MKWLIIGILALQVLLTQTRPLTRSQRRQIALECIHKIGIEQKIIEDAIAGNIPTNNIKYNDFLACSYKKQGYMNEKGELLIENVKEFLSTFYDVSELKPLNACSGNDGDNHGENAYRALKCIMGHLEKLNTTEE